MFEEIEILSNQFAKELSRLKQKKFRDETGKVIVEGIRLIEQIISNGIMPESLLTCDASFTGILPFKIPYHGNILRTTVSHMEQICDTKQPQEWAAVLPCLTQKITNGKFILYLDHISDPGNLGTIFRTAAAAGVSGIIRSDNCCELFNPKVIRASLGAVFFVPTEVHDIAYIKSFPGIKVAMCMDGSESIFGFEVPDQDILLILGSEAEGIHKDIIEIADARIRIPISKQMESLNVSVSAGIAIYMLNISMKS